MPRPQSAVLSFVISVLRAGRGTSDCFICADKEGRAADGQLGTFLTHLLIVRSQIRRFTLWPSSLRLSALTGQCVQNNPEQQPQRQTGAASDHPVITDTYSELDYEAQMLNTKD